MIRFGFKRALKRDETLFDYPYLTMEVRPEEGKVHKFWLRNQVRELLEFNIKGNKLSWFFDADEGHELSKDFYLINITKTAEEIAPCIYVNLDLSFNSKPLFDRMEKIMALDTTQRNHFELVKVDPIMGFPAVKIVLSESDNYEAKAAFTELQDDEETISSHEELDKTKLETII